jgi:hypothetical protein
MTKEKMALELFENNAQVLRSAAEAIANNGKALAAQVSQIPNAPVEDAAAESKKGKIASMVEGAKREFKKIHGTELGGN